MPYGSDPVAPQAGGGYGKDPLAVTAPAPQPAPSHGYLADTALGLGVAGGESFGDTMLGAQELVGHALHAAGFEGAGEWLINDAQTGAEKLKKQAAPYRENAPVASFGGDIVGNLPLAMALPELKAGVLAQGALGGAVGGALQPTEKGTDFATEKAKDVAAGGLGGAAIAGAGKAASSVIAPKVSKEVQMLMERGVQMTPGQLAGGMLRSAENAISSVPVVGSFIRGAQHEATESFNRAVINDALQPIGQKLPAKIDLGRDAVDHAAEAISNEYRVILPRVKFKVDAPFDAAMTNLVSLAKSMPPDQQAQFAHILNNNVVSRILPTGSMLGETMKLVDSDLGKLVRQYQGSPLGSEKQMAQAIKEAQRIMREAVTRQNPDLADALTSVNSAFARLARVEGAAGYRSTSGGLFTPGDLLAAIKRGDASARDQDFARGKALGQPFAEAAQKVLPNNLPNSGTPERMGWLYGLYELGKIEPKTAATMGALTAPYTKPALKMANKLAQPAGPDRQAIADAMRRMGLGAAPGVGIDFAHSLYPANGRQ